MDHWKKFTEATVIESLAGTDIEAVLEEILAIGAKAHKFGKPLTQAVREAMAEKISMGATGALGNGIAVPHVKVEGVKKTSAVFAVKPDGIDFRAGDGSPVSIIFYVVGPADAPESHLEFMRWVATIARNADFRRFALSCKSKKDILELLEEMSQGVSGA